MMPMRANTVVLGAASTLAFALQPFAMDSCRQGIDLGPQVALGSVWAEGHYDNWIPSHHTQERRAASSVVML